MAESAYDPASLAGPADTQDIRALRMSVRDARAGFPFGYRADDEARALGRLAAALEAAGRHDEARSARELADPIVARLLQPDERELAAAQQSGDPGRQALARIAAGGTLMRAGRAAEASASFDRAEQLADQAAATVTRRDFSPRDFEGRIVGPSALRSLEAALRGAGRDEAAGRVAIVIEQAGEAMTDAAVDWALQAAERARQSRDAAGEARAMSVLARAFGELRRTREADFCSAEAARLAGGPEGASPGPDGTRGRGPGRRPADRAPSAGGFHSFAEARDQVSYLLMPGASLDVELLTGYVAVKLIGPFLQAFAAKLGERLGESTSRAIGRLRVLRDRSTGRTELDVMTSGTTTLVLPGRMTDEARLAFLDLDMTDPGLQGATLRWDEQAGKWLLDAWPGCLPR
jgi:tetratricopeptide (TPR) repeat protein